MKNSKLFYRTSLLILITAATAFCGKKPVYVSEELEVQTTATATDHCAEIFYAEEEHLAGRYWQSVQEQMLNQLDGEQEACGENNEQSKRIVVLAENFSRRHFRGHDNVTTSASDIYRARKKNERSIEIYYHGQPTIRIASEGYVLYVYAPDEKCSPTEMLAQLAASLPAAIRARCSSPDAHKQ